MTEQIQLGGGGLKSSTWFRRLVCISNEDDLCKDVLGITFSVKSYWGKRAKGSDFHVF